MLVKEIILIKINSKRKGKKLRIHTTRQNHSRADEAINISYLRPPRANMSDRPHIN